MADKQDTELWKKLYQQQFEENRKMIDPSQGSILIKKPSAPMEEEAPLEEPYIDPIDLAVGGVQTLGSKGLQALKIAARQNALKNLGKQQLGQRLESFTKELNPDLYKYQTMPNVKPEQLSPEFLSQMEGMAEAQRLVNKSEVDPSVFLPSKDNLQSSDRETVRMLFPNVMSSLEKTKKIQGD